MSARYVVGIDLGTTNVAVAYAPLGDENAEVVALAIPQLVAPGEVAERSTLPSFLYLPGKELAPEAAVLPWGAPGHVVGELARARGSEVPARLVSSAKSWLSHGGVDRTAALLPVGAPGDDVPRVSPVQASSYYLSHVRHAWDHLHASDGALLADQEILLTVPASFDAVARELTVRAATEAGLPHVTLLEEPQAAFYAWLAKRGEAWRKELVVGDVVLVCDVGGGTTDFSLIAAVERNGSLELERVAVGDHILLGGDNMDLALAYRCKQRLEADGHTLDAWQMTALTYACRGAKEQLLAGTGAESAPVTILGRGGKLIGGSISTEVSRAEVEELLVDGFFPMVEADARPEKARRAALRTLGLPYASDAGVTRHLAAFVGAHRPATAVLFNGGVMKAKLLQRRVTETLDNWSASPEDDLKLLGGTDLDLAVAEGAAYYGLVRKGRGVRIRGGTARAYYLGIESTEPAVPGMTPPLRALCVAPFGMEEGSELSIDTPDLGLVIGEPVEFRFLTSSTRRDDAAGTMIEDARDLQELAPVEATLEGDAVGSLVPISLRARLDEVGTLSLSCVELHGGRAHQLAYNLRERD
ncbi:MAG: Hsp70 family protein [Polyangia bacterium]